MHCERPDNLDCNGRRYSIEDNDRARLASLFQIFATSILALDDEYANIAR
jgi:hypothetical protein